MKKSKVKFDKNLLTDLKEYNRIMRQYGSKQMSEQEYLIYRQGKMRVKTKAVKSPMDATTLVRTTARMPSGTGVAPDNGTYKEPQTYSGTKLIGIGMMHKSNVVPIFSKEDAIEISTMRRS
jgi:hypothetical protein